MALQLNERFYVSPQIEPDEVKALAEKGIALIINNRPEGEAPDQPTGAAIEQAAIEAGISYVAIPVGPNGISEADLDAFWTAVDAHDGPALGYCKSGLRSAVLRAFALAFKGTPADTIINEASAAGLDISMQRPTLEAIAAQQGAKD